MSFLAAAFLLGFAALAVPWWLHRIDERTPAQTTVASLMLMREVEEPVRTRRTLAHRALLALRLAFLAAVALAFAQPMVETAAGFAPVDSARPAKLVVLDSSFSMRREAVWAEAVATARRLFDADAGDRAIAAGARLTMLSDLAGAEPGWSRFDFAGLPDRLAAIVAALPEPAGGWEYHIVSDFQASAIPERFNALVGGSWPFVLHPVGGFENNWAVESIELADEGVGVVVASFAAVGRVLGVRFAGEHADLAIAAGSRERATFPLSPEQRQAPREVVIAADDALPADDVRRFVLPGKETAAVAVVASNVDDNALGFLVAALEAGGIAKPIVVQNSADWPRTPGAVALLDPGELPSALQRRVERHLEQGGGALLVVGPRTRRHGKLAIGGGALAASVSLGAARQVVVADESHPIAAAGKGWEDVAVERSLTLAASPRETVLALAPSDTPAGASEPLLVERRIGKGRLLILLTALDRTWSSLVLRPAFVGLIGGAMNYLAGSRALHVHAGEPLALPGAPAQVFDAAGARVLALGETGRRPVAHLDRPGVYTVRMPAREMLLAVNADVRESNLRPAPASLLDRWQEATARQEDSPAPASQSPAMPGQHALAPLLLALAAALLVAESLAANIGAGGFRRAAAGTSASAAAGRVWRRTRRRL